MWWGVALFFYDVVALTLAAFRPPGALACELRPVRARA